MLGTEQLYAAYEAASGLHVDPKRIRYFSIYNRYTVSVLLLGAAARAAQVAGTHQDVLLNYVSGMGYVALAELRDFFAGAST
jgi:hypothetical protein